MFVYGIRCNPCDLLHLHADAVADYYMNYSLLVFPSYTRPTALRAYGRLTPDFWAQARKVIQGTVYIADNEHPWITDNEDTIVRKLQELNPAHQTNWYYVPRSNFSVETDSSEE
jgi:hypothetical protein